MTDHTTETVKYAIRLPDGKLCDDLVERRMSPKFDRLPDGTTAYLWSRECDARGQINDIAYKMRQYGMADAFPELAKVVEVRIRYELHDLTADVDSSDEAEPRTWDNAADVPEGVTVRFLDGVNTYKIGVDDVTRTAPVPSGRRMSKWAFSQLAEGAALVEVLP